MVALRLRELRVQKSRSGMTRSNSSGTCNGATWWCCCARRLTKWRRSRNNSAARACRCTQHGRLLRHHGITDLLSLLQLLDNPLQDVPVLAVLRSPLAGCRSTSWRPFAWPPERLFLVALEKFNRSRGIRPGNLPARPGPRAQDTPFLELFEFWRRRVRQGRWRMPRDDSGGDSL